MDRRSKTTLLRLSFRLVAIIGLAALWPGPSAALATGALCVLLAAGCLVTAVAFDEPLRHAGLTRWHEAAILIAVACLVFLLALSQRLPGPWGQATSFLMSRRLTTSTNTR
jgi:hypothetical protein